MYGILLPPETKLEFFVSPPPPACPRFPKNIYECEAPAFIFFWWKPALLLPHKMSKSGTHAPIPKKPTMFSFFSPVLFYMGSCAIATRKKIIMPAHTLLWRTKNKKCDLLKITLIPCTECGEWIGKRQWRHFALLLGAREQLARDLALKLTDYHTETREVKSFFPFKIIVTHQKKNIWGTICPFRLIFKKMHNLPFPAFRRRQIN